MSRGLSRSGTGHGRRRRSAPHYGTRPRPGCYDTTIAARLITFGYHIREGARHWVITGGLAAHRIVPEECWTDVHGLIGKCRALIRRYSEASGQADVVLVTFPCQFILPLAWLLTRWPRKQLWADAFISQYDTAVADRLTVGRGSLKGWLLWLLDWLTCRLADRLLVDTPEHAEYFTTAFGADPSRITVVPIGCRGDIFRPLPAPAEPHPFTIVFHGTFIPLQGIETILRAMAALEREAVPVRCRIIGKGQTKPAMEALAAELHLTSVTFTGPMPASQVAEEIAAADACLGIFGTSQKALRVIPHKAYEILSCGRPLVTGDTPAARRVLRDGTDALLTAPGDPEALAAALRRLRDDPALRTRLSEEGRLLSLERFQPETIVQPLLTLLAPHGS